MEEDSGGSRYVWMLSGERPLAPPGTTAPRDLAAFISTLSATSSAIGRWAAPQDVGAVRLIAQLPYTRAGRQVEDVVFAKVEALLSGVDASVELEIIPFAA